MRDAVLIFLVLAILPAALAACLWDQDTLRQERARFPATLELITGKFPRHSKEFYEWRIQDRIKKLAAEPENLAYLDDLAVAYDKIGRDDLAIATVLKKEAIKPGLYETHANLGTFYLHSGELEKGLRHINRSLEINPNAHFGRERYQKLLVEYLLERRQAGRDRPPLFLETEKNTVFQKRSFADYVLAAKEASTQDERRKEVDAAVKGIGGMMRFGNYASPYLLEAMGDLLSSDPGTDAAKRLAARAYLKASYEVKEPAAARAYRDRAKEALRYQTRGPATTEQLTLEELEPFFKAELEEAGAWYASLRRDEIQWIKDDKDPEDEFDRKYYRQEPSTMSPEDPGPEPAEPGAAPPPVGKIALVLLAGLGTLGLWIAWLIRDRKRQPPAN